MYKMPAMMIAPMELTSNNNAKKPLLTLSSFFIFGKNRMVIFPIPNGMTTAAIHEKEYINLNNPMSAEDIKCG